jgi:cell fate regulator YaaT (PSP1 superfamily)
MNSVVGVRFQKLGKLYHFGTGNIDDIVPGDHVVVETKRGRQLGQVIAFVEEEKAFNARNLRNIKSRATPRELVMQQVWQEKELGALITCREKAAEQAVQDVKFIKAEYSYDGSWLTFYYTTENRKLRMPKLQTALARVFRCRVELQLIGPRDVARFLGGYGACGQPRCCSTFLTEFSGRLRCCLVYEYEQYVEAKKILPKFGKRVETPQGPGRVVDVRAIRDSVVVEFEDGNRVEFFREQLEPTDELEALEKKAAAGCSKHEGGGCDCGARKADSDVSA